MFLKNRLRHWLTFALSNSIQRRRTSGRNRRRSSQAAVELLESRTLLATFLVSNVNDAGTGSLRQAVLDANANAGPDVIDLSGAPAGTISLTTGEIAVTDSVSINGANHSVSGNNASRIFLVGGFGAKTISINGLTLRNGNGVGGVTNGFGGAIYVYDAYEGNDTLNLQNCTLTSNSGILGGAIRVVDNTLNITNCMLSGNTQTGTGHTRGGGAIATQASVTTIQNSTISNNTAAGTGGGIYNFTSLMTPGERDSTLTLINSTISENVAFNGGGIHSENQNAGEAARLSIINSTLSGNFATESGGGILTNSIASITGSTFVGNYGLSGGAIYNSSGAVTLSNSTVSRNTAGVFGGGIWNLLSGSMIINSCTFVGNRADSDGDGYGVGGAFSEFYASVVSRNSLYAGNVRGTIGADIPDDVTKDPATPEPAFVAANSFNNLIGDPNSAGGLTHGQNGNILGNGSGALRPLAQIVNPLLANNGGPTLTHALAVGSPAIDAGAGISDVLVKPLTATSNTSATDLLPAANLLNSAGLTLQNFATTDDGANRWVTTSPNGAGSDYFTNDSTTPVLTFSLDNIYLLTDIAVWGFSDPAVNDDAKTLKVEFSLDGGTTFPNSVTVTKPRYLAQNFMHTLPFGSAFAANTVRLTVVDNYFGEPGNGAGNRVGIDEIRFLQRGLTSAQDQRGPGFARTLDGNHVGGAVIDIGAFESPGIRLLNPNPNAFSLRPTFTWTPIAGATSYSIQINNESTNVAHFHDATSNSATYTPTVDLAIGKFKMWIRPIFGVTLGNWSAPHLFNNLTPTTWQVMQRTQLTSRPTLNWNALPGTVKFDLWVDNFSTGQQQLIRQEITGTTFTPAADLPMGLYRCWIRGVDAKGNFAFWSVLQELLVVPGPTPVGPLSATFDRTPTFSWNSVTGAVSYELYAKNLNTQAMVINGQTVAATNFTPATNLADGLHRWWTIAVSPASIGPIKSGGSNPTDIYIGGRPTFIAPAAGSSTSDRTPTFSWKPVDGATSYRLQVNRTDVPQNNVINQVGLTGTSFTPVADLVAGTYRAWVRAVSSTGELSPWSIEVNFTVTSVAPADDVPGFHFQLAGLLVSDLASEDYGRTEAPINQAVVPLRADSRIVESNRETAVTKQFSILPVWKADAVEQQWHPHLDYFMQEFATYEFVVVETAAALSSL